MSTLSRYYYKKYMVKTLTNRMSCYGWSKVDEYAENSDEARSLLSAISETYESATSGFFASAGHVVPKKN